MRWVKPYPIRTPRGRASLVIDPERTLSCSRCDGCAVIVSYRVQGSPMYNARCFGYIGKPMGFRVRPYPTQESCKLVHSSSHAQMSRIKTLPE